jgi:LmbE family N-acetylglucosaminyl deacetylase
MTTLRFIVLAITLAITPVIAQKQGAELLKTDILCVLAHPDDETGMASTIAYYAHERNTIISHVYCTRGEGGGNMVGTHWGRSLGVLREIELQQCLDTLGVRHHFFLDQLDWAYTESAAMTLEKWDRKASLAHLVRIIRNLRPEIILTMNPFPRPGQHGHHQAAGILAVEAYSAAADPSKFPTQLTREGLSTWQTRKLYFRGDSAGAVAKVDPGAEAHTIAGEALRNHRSQGFGRFQRTAVGRPPESYGLIKTAVPAAKNETDLLAGLPLAESEQPATIERLPVAPERIQANFKPRPALTRFHAWAQEQKISHLMTDLSSDHPIVAGQTNTISLLITNHDSEAEEIEVIFKAAAGWKLRPNKATATLAPKEQHEIILSITPPVGARENSMIKATINTSIQLEDARSEAALHPVPHANLAPLAFKPKLDGSSEKWNALAPISITPDQRVQGKADSPTDLSCEIRTGYDAEFLYIDALVHDDVIVSNISPNDIRGHWRTDAIEICVDPTATSEHTLTCFKVGIFPFDLEGNTRAARDADANQGPIKETAVGMRTKAVRTDTGYRLQTAIPWKVIGVTTPAKGQIIGFNVILYDGDKADAAIGENVNECRLAWAPRSGVQGRPEDWGRLTLD